MLSSSKANKEQRGQLAESFEAGFGAYAADRRVGVWAQELSEPVESGAFMADLFSYKSLLVNTFLLRSN
ncbi:hypothetical protein [Arcanobacterium phocae]|uniref:hypothetical protein n=1 Tax=Arcanobacterium phocae TaxID=131112 RepID=UPI001C0EA936|nr:hypothetical protein [Arcanobacterium phocae]